MLPLKGHMPSKVLTPKSVAAAKTGPMRREIPDGIVPGLYLVVQPTGRKSWALRFRLRGRPIKMTLGTPAVLSLAKARDHARWALEQVQLGKDPRPKKKAQTVTLPGTLSELCDRYVDGFIKKEVRRPGPAQG